MLPFYSPSHPDETPGIMRYSSSMREYGGKITNQFNWGGGSILCKDCSKCDNGRNAKIKIYANDFVGSAPEYLDMSAPCVT